MNSEWRNRYEAMVELAQRAGEHALGYFDRGIAIETKADLTPVTVADREAEQLLREELLKRFPQDGFLGEEFGEQPSASSYRWIIDPIDATRNFVRNIPLWATLVALEHRGEMIAGICCIPALGQTYRALRGEGAYRGDRRIRVSDVESLDKALLSYTSFSVFEQTGTIGQFLKLLRATERSRGFTDFYGFVLVAQGSVDVMFDSGVHIWDIAPLQVIVEEAGGRFTCWDGARDLNRPDVLASNGRLHSELVRLLKE
jgi:histidinol-phosphatase